MVQGFAVSVRLRLTPKAQPNGWGHRAQESDLCIAEATLADGETELPTERSLFRFGFVNAA